MNPITHGYIIDLLTNYRSNKRKALQLTYELENLQPVSPEEMLIAMSFSHPSGEIQAASHISDKTSRIALSFREESSQANIHAREALLSALLPLLQDLDRLEHYVCALDRKQSMVITRLYFDGCSQEDVAEELACSDRTIRSLKQTAIDILVEMYQLTQFTF